ncbi:hypothetical protein ABIF94_005323 [Bradyrhizobium ottawaense]|uniref:hypothetical protein n=1 Tax=Bradyrhizobium ottawaense TaxID=931866 RepID=UPI0038332893
MIATLAEAALRSLVLGGVVWFGLNLFRVRNPHVHMTAWVVVLLASLAMPFVMHWPTLTITRLPLPVVVPDDFLPADISMLETPQPALPVAPGIAIAPQARSGLSINWWLIATIIYAGIAGLLLLRLAIGLCLTWRLARAAKPMNGLLMIAADVRVSRDVGGPVTFGSTILVPPQFAGWDAKKRLAVLAHEGAHVANRDFYVLLLASLNRAVFLVQPVLVVAARAPCGARRDHQRRRGDRGDRRSAVLCGNPARFCQHREAAAGRASDGAGLDRARPCRAHHRGCRHARRGQLAKAAVDRGCDRPRGDRVRRHDRLSHAGRGARRRGCRRGARPALPPVRQFLRYGSGLGVRHLP